MPRTLRRGTHRAAVAVAQHAVVAHDAPRAIFHGLEQHRPRQLLIRAHGPREGGSRTRPRGGIPGGERRRHAPARHPRIRGIGRGGLVGPSSAPIRCGDCAGRLRARWGCLANAWRASARARSPARRNARWGVSSLGGLMAFLLEGPSSVPTGLPHPLGESLDPPPC